MSGKPTFKRVLNTLVDTIPTYAAGAGIIAITLTILFIVFTRNLGIRVPGLLSLSQIIGVWVIFILVASVAKEQRHIQIGFFTDRLPEPLDRIHELAIVVLKLVAALIFLYSAILATNAGLGSTVSGLGIPTAVMTAAAVVGFGLLVVIYVLQAMESVGIITNVTTEGDA